MPKLHSIHIQVEEVAVGYVMRVLNTTPGVAKINYDADGFQAKPNKKPNGSYNQGKPRAAGKGINGQQFIVQLLAKAGGPLTQGDLANAFEKDGRSRASPPSSIDGLKKQGLIVSTGQGYALSKKMKDRLRHRKEA